MTSGDSDDSRQEYINALVSSSFIALWATILRFWCQLKNERRGIHSLHPDDWLLLATSLTYFGAGAGAAYGLVYGEVSKRPLKGPPVTEEDYKIATFFEALFIGQTILYLTVFLAKLTICMLYRRIFSIHLLRRACLYLMLASTMWFIAAEVTNLCICIPIHLFWYPDPPTRCLNFNLFALSIGIAEVFLDIAILILPVQVVLGLQMPPRAKLVVTGIFLLGGFSIITNILRISYQFQMNSDLVNMKNAFVWSTTHGAVTILCACLPVYKPVRDILGRFFAAVQEKCALLSGRSSPTLTRPNNEAGSKFTNNILDTRRSSGKNQALHVDNNTRSSASEKPHTHAGYGHHNAKRRSDVHPPPPYAAYGHCDFSSGGEEELEDPGFILRPEATQYTAVARHSDLSGEEFLHANTLRGDMSTGIACTTKVEVV